MIKGRMKDPKTKWRDIYGNIWILRCRFFNTYFEVWNEELGWGVWDNGKGLSLTPRE